MSNGRFVWRDLMTTEPERAKAFYQGVFGWDIRPTEMPGIGVYEWIYVGEEGLGGVVPLDATHGVPSHWISYITVPDSVDAACERATAKGATIGVPPMDIPAVGRFAVMVDSEGAVCSPFSPADGASAEESEESAPAPGMVSWNELVVADVDRALELYGTVFGWTGEPWDVGVPYTVLKSGDRLRAGLMQQPEPMPGLWVIYFAVAHLDATTATIAELGGQTIGDVITVPEVGRVQWATDPTGALFALHEPAA